MFASKFEDLLMRLNVLFLPQGSNTTELHWEARLGILLVSSSTQPVRALSLAKLSSSTQPVRALSWARGKREADNLNTGRGRPGKDGLVQNSQRRITDKDKDLIWWNLAQNCPKRGITQSRLGLSTLLQVSLDRGPVVEHFKLTLSDYLC